MQKIEERDAKRANNLFIKIRTTLIHHSPIKHSHSLAKAFIRESPSVTRRIPQWVELARFLVFNVPNGTKEKLTARKERCDNEKSSDQNLAREIWGIERRLQ